MNKTVNINLGGMFFHIDEDAYQKLTRYFDAIKRSLSNSTGQDEIIRDIEMRIGEIITGKHASDKQVINVKEVDEIIAIMGQPEDYRLEDENFPAGPASFDYTTRHKKLYRDTERGMLGGVSRGLGYYFGIDPVWIRIIFVIFILASFGAGILAYFVLWIVTPAALTTTEKLEMTGEPVTISNIERKVREEFDNVSEKFKNADYDKMGRNVKTGVERVAGNVGEALSKIFKAFAKVLGALITVISGLTLAGLLIALVAGSSISFVNLPWHDNPEIMNYTSLPMWAIYLLGYLAIAIPFFFLFILGLKLLITNMKSIGSVAKYTLLAVWLITVGILISLAVKQATEMGYDGKTVQKETINIMPADTLEIKFQYNDFYAKDVRDRNNFSFVQDEKGNEVIYSNEISLHVLKTDSPQPYLQIEKKARGRSLAEAKKRAENIAYGYKIVGNSIVLNNYLLADIKEKYRSQEVELYLYLPKGTLLKADESVQEYDRSDDDFFNLHWSGNYTYRVEPGKVKCLDCPADENEWNDVNDEKDDAVEDSSASVVLNKDGILIRRNNESESKQVKSVRINEDGITIKTK